MSDPDFLSTIARQLRTKAGVEPSQHWLEDCVNELQLRGNVSADAVLEQILYHDLRDVVRVFEPEPAALDNTHPAVVLRRALRESQANAKSILPNSFQLLVQVEELLDVSQNAETRLAVGPASPNAPTPIGNQQTRCLKLCLSDGYSADGTRYQDENTAPNFFLTAMEVSPIPNLSVNSRAGIKVLLHGNVILRHGVLLLHPGCCTVLGGSVEELSKLQTTALLQAQRVAGVGVDPTIKALVWNSETGEMEQEDEGEQESSDVPPANHPPSAPTAATTAVPPRMVPPSSVSQPPAVPSRPVTSRMNASQQRQQQPTARTSQQQLHPVRTTSHASSQAAAVPQQQHRQTAPPAPTTTPSSRNPYASTTLSSRSNTSSSNNPYHDNPYQSSSQGGSDSHHPNQSHPPVGLVTSTTTSASLTVSNQQYPPPVPNAPLSSRTTAPSDGLVTSSTATTTRRLPFGVLRDELALAREDEAIYRQMAEKVFVIQLQQQGLKLYFDIGKKKKKDGEKKKKGDKYEYVMHAKFGSPQGEGLITCKIANSILEPFFTMAPGEMRKLSREDKARSGEVILTGGNHVKNMLHKLNTFEVTLLRSLDEFFRSSEDPSPPLDGPSPVLEILKKID